MATPRIILQYSKVASHFILVRSDLPKIHPRTQNCKVFSIGVYVGQLLSSKEDTYLALLDNSRDQKSRIFRVILTRRFKPGNLGAIVHINTLFAADNGR